MEETIRFDEIRFVAEWYFDYTLLWRMHYVGYDNQVTKQELVCWLHGKADLDDIYSRYMEHIARGDNPLLAIYE